MASGMWILVVQYICRMLKSKEVVVVAGCYHWLSCVLQRHERRRVVEGHRLDGLQAPPRATSNITTSPAKPKN